ncbi:hypothetical protein PR202_ga20689 [Eleusine coracana subsp. coracana]|uniref:DUF7771 domain-containing protein n=1 Tax=Eleusine coracana subsp. coracana TaxID=191504 RepID=A0AAV5CY20_ELECO|nr:hypothetical protein PR202_ga20689 [Eleusine coracana subsp. coracana]
MSFNCMDHVFDLAVRPGETAGQVYSSVLDPAPTSYRLATWRTNPNVTCRWQCAGNTMSHVVVWSEQWPEMRSCRTDRGDGQCRLVFESSREVVLVMRAGQRVLGDVAINDCSKSWLSFGLGCTYPKHHHEYYGTIGYL